MKAINYLLIFLLFCSFATQNDITDEIKKNFLEKIKTLLSKRGPFDYNNTILNPNNITGKILIIDQVELNNTKINEIGKRYNLEEKALEQIRTAFFQSQPNIYKDFEFTLNSADLNKIIDNALFTEYIGCCFRQDNMINYILLRLSINTQIYEKKAVESKWCIFEYENEYIFGKEKKTVEKVRESCLRDLNDECCTRGRSDFDENKCKDPKNQLIFLKPRPLNDTEKLEANKLVSAYSGEIFNLMIDETEKKAIKIDENLTVQSFFISGQIFKNESYYVEAEVTDYGDVEIKESASGAHIIFDKECQSKNIYSYFYIMSKCVYYPPCIERRSEYLVNDQNGISSCTKLKELRKTKMETKMEIYTDGSIAIKQGAGVLFYAKPNIKGKSPFTVGVTKKFELQIIDSNNVVVWKSNPVFIHDAKQK